MLPTAKQNETLVEVGPSEARIGLTISHNLAPFLEVSQPIYSYQLLRGIDGIVGGVIGGLVGERFEAADLGSMTRLADYAPAGAAW